MTATIRDIYECFGRERFYKPHPLFEKLFVSRLLDINRGIVRERSLWFGKIKLTFFRISNIVIIEIREANHGTSPYATRHNAISNHTNNVVNVEVCETLSLTPQHF